MFAALLLILATKSILDAFWEYRFGPLSFSSFGSIIIPLIFLPLLRKRKMVPEFWKTKSYLIFIALSLGLVWSFPVKTTAAIEQLIISINIFLGFYIFPLIINSAERLRKILVAIIIGGIFPVAVSLFQYQTGIIFQERETVGLIRYVGFYHDAFPVRFYGLFNLFTITVYFYLIKPNRKIWRIVLFVIAFLSLFSVYLVFSKAAIAILALWLILLIYETRSKLKVLFASTVLLCALFVLFGDVIFSNIEQLFSKEVGFQSGQVKDARYTLSGRGYIWEDYWDFWSTEQTLFFQWFGDGLKRSAHNEYFRVLLVNGIIGFVVFLFFLSSMFVRILNSHKRLRVFCLMLFGMYCIDCIGLDTGNYYYYNILLWGFIGLFLTKNIYNI
jgi:O-antigen ligase